jgi:hypothetical protein
MKTGRLPPGAPHQPTLLQMCRGRLTVKHAGGVFASDAHQAAPLYRLVQELSQELAPAVPPGTLDDAEIEIALGAPEPLVFSDASVSR